MQITHNIYQIGVHDTQIDLFEGQFPVPDGMSYHSYLILDEKITVIDSVEISFSNEWLSHIKKLIGDKKPDYLIIQHMEPDHSGSIMHFMNLYPECTIAASQLAFTMMKNMFHTEFSDRRLILKNQNNLNLGNHCLQFFCAPFVHWPEVMMSYESTQQILFSADAFGSFGCISSLDNWKNEARRYYFNIVGKYGVQVQQILNKLSTVEIQMICPLHGPILDTQLSYYVHLYEKWSSYQPEQNGITIAYTSFYGNTKQAVLLLKKYLQKRGIKNISFIDLVRDDLSYAVSESFKNSHLILASPTYNGTCSAAMKNFLHHLIDRNFSNHTISLIENSTWSPMSIKSMKNILSVCKNIHYTNSTVQITSVIDSNTFNQIQQLADEIVLSLQST